MLKSFLIGCLPNFYCTSKPYNWLSLETGQNTTHFRIYTSWLRWKIMIKLALLFCFAQLIINAQSILVRFEINEEVPVESHVGSLTTYLHGGGGRLRFIKVMNVKDASKYFSVDNITGKITVADRLDREVICHTPTRRSEDDCELRFSVSCLAAANNAVHDIADVVITLRDINDNGCHFLPSDSKTVTIREDASVEQTRIRLYTPIDLDSTRLSHSIQWNQVRLEDASGLPSSIFRLYKTDLSETISSYSMSSTANDGKMQLFLGLLRPLDFEKVKEYHIYVVAGDGIQEADHNCKLSVHVQVEDVNDNLPIFEKAVYNVLIAENTPFDQNIVTVMANDADSGDYGNVFYTIDPYLTEPSTLALFRINQQTGEIFLKNRLNYLFSSTYQLTVRASNQLHATTTEKDTSSSSSSSAFFANQQSYLAKVLITVKDVNDHAPRMHIFSPTGSEKLALTEGLPSGQDVAIVSVDDEDSGRNAEVECKLEDQSIRDALTLESMKTDRITAEEPSSGRKYKMLAVQTFDHEIHSKIQFTIECWDHGEPVMRNSQKGVIHILDVNDNAPVFEKDKYHFEVFEDAQTVRTEKNVHLGSLRATDLDFGPNAELSYHFASDCSPTFHDLINMDADTGIFHSTGRLDREKVSVLKCRAIVVDKGNPPLSSSVEVEIKILDSNDNAPQFDQSEYTFNIEENSPIGSLVGTLRAFDFDLEANAKLEFTMENAKSVWSPHTDMESLFSINRDISNSESNNLQNQQIGFLRFEVSQMKHHHTKNWSFTGIGGGGSSYEVRLYTASTIDREQLIKANILDSGGFAYAGGSTNKSDSAISKFKVRAQDFGSPRLAQRVGVTLFITDTNDNYPVFIYPTVEGENTTEVHLSIREPLGFQFTKISAIDNDAGENGTLKYRIRAGDPFDLFLLNPQSGEMFVDKAFNSGYLGHYLLFIEASDCGSPMRTSEAKILITMDNSEPLGQVERDFFGFPILSRISGEGGVGSSNRNFNLYIIIAIIVASFVISTILLVAICFVVKRARRENRSCYQPVRQLDRSILPEGNGFIKTVPLSVTPSTYARNGTVEDEDLSDLNFSYMTPQFSLTNGYSYENSNNEFHSTFERGLFTPSDGGIESYPSLMQPQHHLHEMQHFSTISGGVDHGLRLPPFTPMKHQVQTINRCNYQGHKKSMEDRLTVKRNSLTSADCDSGNGDSVDVATATQPCTLPPGTRLFSLSTTTNPSPFGLYNQQIKPTHAYNGCGESKDQYIALELRPTQIDEITPLYRVRESSIDSRCVESSVDRENSMPLEKLNTTFV